MKLFLVPLVLLCMSVTSIAADIHTNAIYLKIVKDGDDVPSIIRDLPAIETLWPDDPKAYFYSEVRAAHVLDNAIHIFDDMETNTVAIRGMTIMLTNVIHKPLPEDSAVMLDCLEPKIELLGLLFRCKANYTNSISLVARAKLVGEMRAKIIPDYQPQLCTLENSLGASQKGIQAVTDNNQRIAITNLLQMHLTWFARNSSASLVEDTQQYLRDHPKDTNFVQTIISTARLTKDEVGKINDR